MASLHKRCVFMYSISGSENAGETKSGFGIGRGSASAPLAAPNFNSSFTQDSIGIRTLGLE